MALYMAIFAGGTPIGAPVVGWAANTFGPRWAMGIAAVSGLLAASIAITWMVRRRNLRLRRTPNRRFRVHFRYDGDKRGYEREMATQEIAIVESTAKRIG